jgi:hypothetical protein
MNGRGEFDLKFGVVLQCQMMSMRFLFWLRCQSRQRTKRVQPEQSRRRAPFPLDVFLLATCCAPPKSRATGRVSDGRGSDLNSAKVIRLVVLFCTQRWPALLTSSTQTDARTGDGRQRMNGRKRIKEKKNGCDLVNQKAATRQSTRSQSADYKDITSRRLAVHSR